MTARTLLVGIAPLVLLAACGSSSTPGEWTTSNAAAVTSTKSVAVAVAKKHVRQRPRVSDRGTAEAAPLATIPSRDRQRGRYPAFRPDMPQVVDNGGPTLRHPRIVTITWDGDPDRASFEQFGDELGFTPYWYETTSEYRVGFSWSGSSSHVHVADALPAPISDMQLEDWIRSHVAAARASAWPENDDQTIYAVYLAPGSQLQFFGQDACQSALGYHTDALLSSVADAGTGPEFNYAVIVRCPDQQLSDLTDTASHEFIEAATDPFPNANPAYYGFDKDHFAYELYQEYQDELGDACEFFASSNYTESPPFAFGVQRTWSNRSAREGHNPCVPLAREAYFNVTTFAGQMDDITVDLTSAGDTTHTTKGFKVALGQTRTFDIGFYSDRPTSGDWTVSANDAVGVGYVTDQNGKPLANGQATITIDQPSGSNGHRARVSVTPSSGGAIGGQYIELVSTDASGTQHTFPVLVAQQ